MPIAKNVDCDVAWSCADAVRSRAPAGIACARATRAGSAVPPGAWTTAATESPIAFRFELNDRASETATSDPMLESGEPITRISPPWPACTCLREPRGEDERRVDVAVLGERLRFGDAVHVAERDEVEALQHAAEVRGKVSARVGVDDGVVRVEPRGLDVAERQAEDPGEPERQDDGHQQGGAIAQPPPEVLRGDRPRVSHRLTPRLAGPCR